MDRWDDITDNIIEKASKSSTKKGKSTYSCKSGRWDDITNAGEDNNTGKSKYSAKNSSGIWDIPDNTGNGSKKTSGITTPVYSSVGYSPSVHGPANSGGIFTGTGNNPIVNTASFLTLRNFGKIIMVLVVAVILITATFAMIAFFSSPAGQVTSIILVIIIFFVMKAKGMLSF